jgi:hypothetical protein
MAMYGIQDIEATDDGDIVLDDLGDIKIANPLRTMGQIVNWTILTNRGELVTDPSFGANLQQFYGERNTEATRNFMEKNIITELVERQIVTNTDLEVDVVALTPHEAAVFVSIDGEFIDTDDESQFAFLDADGTLDMAFEYPFTSGTIVPVSISGLTLTVDNV